MLGAETCNGEKKEEDLETNSPSDRLVVGPG